MFIAKCIIFGILAIVLTVITIKYIIFTIKRVWGKLDD